MKFSKNNTAAPPAPQAQGQTTSAVPAAPVEETAVQVLGPTDMVAPEYVEAEGRGLQNVEAQDLVVPRIKLLQAMSPEVVNSENGEYKAGMLVDSITGEVFQTPLRIVFLDHSKSRRLFEEIEKGGGTLCMSLDGRTNLQGIDCLAACPFKHRYNDQVPAHMWNEKAPKGDKQRKPSCTFFYDFPSVVFSTDPTGGMAATLIAFSCSASKIKVAKNILTTLKRKINPQGIPYDIFATAWGVSSRQQTSGNFKFWNFDVKPFGWPTKEEYELAKKMSVQLASQRYSIHHDADEGDEPDIDASETANKF